MGSAFTLAVVAPATALADMATDPEAAPDRSDISGCVSACGEPAIPEAAGATREDLRQTADQDHAQARYQLGSSQPESIPAPEHPYSQGHYQLGAGHQD